MSDCRLSVCGVSPSSTVKCSLRKSTSNLLFHAIWTLHRQDSRVELNETQLCTFRRCITKNIFPLKSATLRCEIRLNPLIGSIISYWVSLETQPEAKSCECKYCRGASLRSQTGCTDYSEKPDKRDLQIKTRHPIPHLFRFHFFNSPNKNRNLVLAAVWFTSLLGNERWVGCEALTVCMKMTQPKSKPTLCFLQPGASHQNRPHISHTQTHSSCYCSAGQQMFRRFSCRVSVEQREKTHVRKGAAWLHSGGVFCLQPTQSGSFFWWYRFAQETFTSLLLRQRDHDTVRISHR